MFKTILTQKTSPKASILRWFLICFMCFSIIFLIALLPLISYCRNVFTELEIKKSTQQMEHGISQLENTVTSIASASQSLTKDIRFLPFHYKEPNYSDISVSVRTQMQDYLNGLTFPLTLISNCALQFSENIAVTPTLTVFGEQPGYYPFHFYVDDLSYENWEQLLKENGSGFLPVHRVTTPRGSYDALIYSIPWTSGSYLYACLNITDVKQALIAKESSADHYMTIENTRGICLYTDLPDSEADYHSVAQQTVSGSLVITIHIPKESLSERMTPLYVFLGLYLALCAVVLMITIYVGSRVSSKPLLNIVNLLEKNDIQPLDHTAESAQKKSATPLQYGFHYIQHKVQSYESSLSTYRNTISTQTKVLQARFLEKALHGSLVTEKDYEQFFSYFPDFPESFCLVQLGLLERTDENGTLYPDPISLIQLYLQTSIPTVYYQQMTNDELLLIVDEENAEEYFSVLNYLIENINREEPSYHAWAIASRFYAHPKSLPSAYWQLQDLYSRISLESLSCLCSVSDYQPQKKAGFQMSDVVSIHTAVVSGNLEVSLARLQSYSDCLSTNNRSVFEMFRAILLCIKYEYAELLIDIDIPAYHANLDLYEALKKTITLFSEQFKQQKKQTDRDPFVLKLTEYIDLHFTEDDLCMTKLAEEFQCSPSKIQKAFSKELDTTVSAYIEKKRMDLANELLLRGEDTVIEVAKKCGFTNNNTFHKAYRRVFGHTPNSLKQG